ncbi:MAG: protoporphyrinogen oxidase HemJ [Betaproteobacteria bacterium]|nr:protoporphyrinogen oxidase HemJ [Betaproteobacteria bacterium]
MLWIKAFHVVSVIFWSAGLLYLPRLFVYHADAEDETGRRRFCRMESRLYWRIMSPAMAAALLFGMLLLPHYRGGWVGAKLLLVLLLAAFHIYCGYIVRRFGGGRVVHGGRFFRIFNEIPALLIAAIVLLVVLKPF